MPASSLSYVSSLDGDNSQSGGNLSKEQSEPTTISEMSETNSTSEISGESGETSGIIAKGDFLWTSAPVSHVYRRRLIFEKYPEIEKLYGNDPKSGCFAIFTMVLQMWIAYEISRSSLGWPAVVLLTYFVGATLNHSHFSAMHELSHGSFWDPYWLNLAHLLLVNIPMGIPAGVGFWRYHIDHHVFFGVDGLDIDIPTQLECYVFQGAFMKFIFVLLYPLVYTMRPMITRPKKVFKLDVLNWVIVFISNYLVYHYWGAKPLFYLVFGSLFGLSIHPFVGHLIAEHFQFPNGAPFQETFSYYGWMNFFTYNVGYHNEHHDFPRVPGSRIPALRKIASEFYQCPTVESWPGIVLKFIFTPEVCLYSRVKRARAKGGDVPAPHVKRHEGAIPKGSYWLTEFLETKKLK